MDLIVDLSCGQMKFCAASKHFTGNREVKGTSRGETYCPKNGKDVRESDGEGCWDYQKI